VFFYHTVFNFNNQALKNSTWWKKEKIFMNFNVK